MSVPAEGHGHKWQAEHDASHKKRDPGSQHKQRGEEEANETETLTTGPANPTAKRRLAQGRAASTPPGHTGPLANEVQEVMDSRLAASRSRILRHLSFGSSWHGRIEALTVFIFSLYVMVPFGLACLFWSAVLLLFPLTTPAMLGYICWAVWVDESPTTGTRTPFLRGAFWWRRYCDFFPIVLTKTADLDPTRRYVMGYHPHGIISVGAFAAFATDWCLVHDLTVPSDGPGGAADEARGFSSLFPGISRRLLTLSINFKVPFFRELLLWLGLCDASKKTFRSVLSEPGSAVVVVVGGAKESTETVQGGMRLVLEKRRGFVREAILAGADLVPVLAFGENDLYATVHFDHTHVLYKAQEFCRRNFGFTVPVFSGRGLFFDWGFMPYRLEVNIVVGKPVRVTRHEFGPSVPISPEERAAFAPRFDRATGQPENDDARLVEKVHSRYMTGIREVWDGFKNAPWNTAGLHRRGTLELR